MTKVSASEKADAAFYAALQMLGRNGYSAEYPLEQWSRDACITSIYKGTSEIQRIINGNSLELFKLGRGK